MKKILASKPNLITMAAIVAAVVAALLFLAPINAPGTGADNSGPAVSDNAAGPETENTILQEGDTPLSGSGAEDPSEGYKYEFAGEETIPDPYADAYTQNSGNATGNTGGTDSAASSSSGPTATLYINASTAGRGDIMSARTVSFTEGETVFDILYRECRASGIHMASKITPVYNSAYIQGIDNLYEFDGGPLSGWMYSVNGWFPNYGCSQYRVQNGDVISWLYTCDLGRDIGGEGATQG